MKNNKYFIEIRSYQDFWKKVIYEYEKLKSESSSSYQAFNFFVTIYHLEDWFFDGKKSTERTNFKNEVIIKLCSQLANGAKHFEIEKKHNSVKEAERQAWVEEGWVEEGWVEDFIVIHLDNEAKDLFGEKITVIELADRLINFWKEEFNKRNIAIGVG